MPKRCRDDAIDDQTEYTPTTLSMHDGECDNRIFLALKGKVYEVTERRDLYGSGGTYHFLAGKDATRALAKMTFDKSNVDNPRKLDDLNEMEETCLEEWEAKFQGKYEQVGVLMYPDEIEKRDAERDDFYKSSGTSLLDKAKSFVKVKPTTTKSDMNVDKENKKEDRTAADLFSFIDQRQRAEQDDKVRRDMGVAELLPNRVGAEVAEPREDPDEVEIKETCEMAIQCGNDNVKIHAFSGYSARAI